MLHSLTISRAADQALAWLLTYALHSTLLLAMAWVVTRGLGARRLRLQETIWRCAMLGALVTASAQVAFGQLGHAPIAGRWTLAASGAPAAVPADAALVGHASGAAGEAHAAPVPARVPETSAAARAAELATRLSGRHATAPHGVGLGWREGRESHDGRERSVAAGGTRAASGSRPLERSLKSAWSALRPWLLPAWLLGALALTLGHVRSYLALRRRLRYRPQVVGGGVLARLAGLVRQSGLTRRVRLTCTWRLRVPVALGLRAAEVCVPPRALFQLDDEQQDALLAHELAHLARRDPVWLPLTQVLAAVFFFQPLNWLARRRLRELSELLSDEWAVARTGRPLSLAGCLAEVAGWSLAARGANMVQRHPARLPVPGMADRPSQLAHRIRRLLDGAPMVTPMGPMHGQGPARRHRAVLLAAVPTVLLAVALAAPGVSAGSSPAPVTAPACTGSSGAEPATAPGATAACAGSTAVATAAASTPAVRVATTRVAASAVASGTAEVGALPAARASMVMAALAPVEAREQGAAVAAEPVDVSARSAASSASAGTASVPPAAGSPGSASGMAASSSSVDAPPDAEGAPVAGTTPAGASAAAAPAPAAPREHASARDLDAERERLAAAAARLQQLDKLGTLSQEQIAAITAAAERISRDIDGRLREQLEHLNHQLAGAHAGLPRQADLPAAELAELGAELAGMAAQLHPSAQEMAEIDTELSKLAAEQPHLSAEEIEHIQDEAMRGLRQLPSLGLSQAEIDHLHAEVKRALEEMPKLRLSQADLDRLRGEMKHVIEDSAAARSHAMSPAERDKVVANAHRLAERLGPDQAQLEALRRMQHEHEEMTRILAKQRAEIEAMRREILQQTQALRDQARRLTDARRAHPRSNSAAPPPRPARPATSAAPAGPAAPAAPAASPATVPPAAPEPSPAPDAPPPPDAPPAPDAPPPPVSCAG